MKRTQRTCHWHPRGRERRRTKGKVKKSLQVKARQQTIVPIRFVGTFQSQLFASYPHPSSCHMSLLTLNETTLYYYFLSDRISNSKAREDFLTGINGWAKTLPDNDATNLKVASGSGRISQNRSQPPALTNATSRSTSSGSVLSKSIKISESVEVEAGPQDASIKVFELGLEDDDETMGVERDAAHKSPPKGKTRVSSAVSVY